MENDTFFITLMFSFVLSIFTTILFATPIGNLENKIRKIEEKLKEIEKENNK